MAYICYVAGKSGGHIVPALTCAQAYRQERPQNRVLFFSTHSSLDKHIIAAAPHVNEHVPLMLENVPGKKWWRYPMFIAQVVVAVWKSFLTLRRYKPRRVVSMGGYISIPVCVAAWALRIPIDLYELNVVPGKAVQFLAPLATRICICFPEARQYLKHTHIVDVAYPVRFVMPVVAHEAACNALGLVSFKKTICIVGGSQGSAFMNRLASSIAMLPDVQVIHQTGEKDVAIVRAIYAKHHISAIVFAYREDIALCYAAADVVVCRAGAGTLAEVLFFQKPALVIPLEAATTDHQVDNAYAMAHRYPHVFAVMRQDDIEKNQHIFLEKIRHLLETTRNTDKQV